MEAIRVPLAVIVIASTLGAAIACRDVRSNNTHEQPPPIRASADTAWTVRVCHSESSRVDIRAGRSKAASDYFATWHIDEKAKSFTLPAEVQGLDQVYIRAETPSDLPTEVCVERHGETKKRMKFDHWSQEGLVSTADKDTCGC
jgi:hypothetical protein